MAATFAKKISLAERLLSAKFRGADDKFRKRHPFSPDIEATNAILFGRQYNRRSKIRAYRSWLETNQPCVFGKVAAKNKNIFICLLEEQEVLRMKRGDLDLQDTIQDYRQVWKRHALEGLNSSFLLVLVSKALGTREPNDQLKEICRRLMELYMEIDKIDDDTFRAQREYVFLRRTDGSATKLLKFATLPNVFCSQGDGRWGHDHRTPGGIMITSNALGHFVYCRSRKPMMDETAKVQALENAMRTISNAYHPRGRRSASGMKHCPATFLIRASKDEASPLRKTSDFRKYSADHYQGYFHTDHLIPSVYFRKERDPAGLKLYDDLTFRYIYDPTADAQEHEELMTGVEATWYDVRRDMDRLPDFANPERRTGLPVPVRTELARWLERRLRERLES